MEERDDTFFEELLNEICLNCGGSFMIDTGFGEKICKECRFTILDVYDEELLRIH